MSMHACLAYTVTCRGVAVKKKQKKTGHYVCLNFIALKLYYIGIFALKHAELILKY